MMTLYFTNDSKQKRMMIKTNYVDDIYDMIICFFEDHKIRPKFLQLDDIEDGWKISFGSMSEFFYVEGVTDENRRDLEEFRKSM